MAKGKKTGGRNVKPGERLNPNGRPPDPPELKAIKQLTKAEYTLLLCKILNAKPDELKTFNKSVLEIWLASGATKAIQTGDYSRLETLINRLIGVVPTKVEQIGANTVINNYAGKTEEELDAMIKERLWNGEKK